MSTSQDDVQCIGNTNGKQGSLQAALARTISRSIALYFSRPVRLFRPSKVSGWHSLQSLASHQGAALGPTYFLNLIKHQGLGVVPKHFIPPMIVNALLGTVLWTTYAEMHTQLDARVQRHQMLTVALSGAIAGGTQALFAAPAENVRLLIEGGAHSHSWSQAWKEVFRSKAFIPDPTETMSRGQKIKEIRQLRTWLKEVGDMAGRGWSGWGWGVAKDACAFSVFFSVFEATRRFASLAKTSTQSLITSGEYNALSKDHLPRTIHSITLVTGGVIAGLAYEFTCRPWDSARRFIHLESVVSSTKDSKSFPLIAIILRKINEDGLLAFFRQHSTQERGSPANSVARTRLLHAARTLGRVGPWGVGFLVWEAYGPGLS